MLIPKALQRTQLRSVRPVFRFRSTPLSRSGATGSLHECLGKHEREVTRLPRDEISVYRGWMRSLNASKCSPVATTDDHSQSQWLGPILSSAMTSALRTKGPAPSESTRFS